MNLWYSSDFCYSVLSSTTPEWTMKSISISLSGFRRCSVVQTSLNSWATPRRASPPQSASLSRPRQPQRPQPKPPRPKDHPRSKVWRSKRAKWRGPRPSSSNRLSQTNVKRHALRSSRRQWNKKCLMTLNSRKIRKWFLKLTKLLSKRNKSL